VYETHLDGVALALKRTYTHKLGERDLNGIKIMGQLSGKRQEHIVQLIGSYIHLQRNGYEIVLLISPVADCDLASFMLKMDILELGMRQQGAPGDIYSEDEIQSAAELLSAFWKDNPKTGKFQLSAQESDSLYKASQQRLYQSFLCISSANDQSGYHDVQIPGTRTGDARIMFTARRYFRIWVYIAGNEHRFDRLCVQDCQFLEFWDWGEVVISGKSGQSRLLGSAFT
jgi:hypothetical protein